jgi:DNA repair protein RAD50
MLGEDMEDKKGRIKKITTDIKAANYEERLTEKTANARAAENRRDALNTELRSLSLQADARARLDIKRVEFKRKTTDVQNTCVNLTINLGSWIILRSSIQTRACQRKVPKICRVRCECRKHGKGAGAYFCVSDFFPLLSNLTHVHFRFSDKEREHSEMDNTLTTANGELQRLDTTLSHLKAQVKAKREELKRPFLYLFFVGCSLKRLLKDWKRISKLA